LAFDQTNRNGTRLQGQIFCRARCRPYASARDICCSTATAPINTSDGWCLVPVGAASVKCKVGEDREIEGQGYAYHDHKLGRPPHGHADPPLVLGPRGVDTGADKYVVIAANTVAKQEYGSATTPT
jgi:hypothetical protein